MKEREDTPLGHDGLAEAVPHPEEIRHSERSAERLLGELVVRALEEYRRALEAGQPPNRKEFLQRYPDIAASLAECLDALEFVHQASPCGNGSARTDGSAPSKPQSVVCSGHSSISPTCSEKNRQPKTH